MWQLWEWGAAARVSPHVWLARYGSSVKSRSPPPGHPRSPCLGLFNGVPGGVGGGGSNPSFLTFAHLQRGMAGFRQFERDLFAYAAPLRSLTTGGVQVMFMCGLGGGQGGSPCAMDTCGV